MRQDAAALIFGPDLPPGGQSGSLSVSPLGVEVQVGGRSQRADLNAVRLRPVGFGKPGLEITWAEGDDVWVAHVLDAGAARRVLADSALTFTPQANALRGTQARVKARRTIGWSVLLFIVLLPVLLLLALLFNANVIAGWVVDQIPIEQEMEWGRQAFAGMRGKLTLRETGPDVDAVRNIGARLSRDSQYKYEFYVAEDKTLNAFALPGGTIVIHTGLIDATKRPEELAGVIAHEIQHVELRHSIRGMIKEMGLRGAWDLVTGDLGGTLIGQAALELSSFKFSRDDESEADHKGFDSLLSANIDPSGMPEFFKTMSEQASDAPLSFISTHPLSEEREKVLEQRVAALSTRDFPSLDLGVWPPATTVPLP